MAVFASEVTLEVIKKSIAAAPKTHPRLLANSADFNAIKERIKSDSLLAGCQKELISSAKTMLDEAPLKKKKIGRERKSDY